jgi:DNA-binding MarR family transcriptional regulator
MTSLLAHHGLSVPQYNVLRILRGARGESLPTLEIASRMIERSPGITRLLDRLHGKGLVHRERCNEDRRQVLCSITDAGLELLAALDEPVLKADREVFSSLTDAELRQLVKLLDRIRESVAGRD